MKNILSIDVEEPFYYIKYIKNKKDFIELYRTQNNIDSVLKILDEFNITATFFLVGEIAEKFPEIIEKIYEKNHEIAFHGYYHQQLWKQNSNMIINEIKKFNLMIKNKCIGFRAPFFSLNNRTNWVLKVLQDAGLLYDSSIFPTKTPMYGVPNAPITPYKPSYEDVAREDTDNDLWEFPLLVYPFPGINIPTAGGFYLRLLPVSWIRKSIINLNKKNMPAVIYIHNWELDQQAFNLNKGPNKSLLTYYNLHNAKKKFRYLLSNFHFTNFRTYLEDK